MSDLSCPKGTTFNNEYDSEIYDSIYSTSEEYKKYFKDSAYYNLYDKTLEILIGNKRKSVLEVGCGVGTFAQLLYISKAKINYCGFDFSKIAIEEAQKRAPDFKFYNDNAYTTKLFEQIDYDTVVSHEVLEHINDDIGILRKIKRGTFFIGSVPSQDAPNHVRFFNNEQQIIYRYSRCLDIDKILSIDDMFLFYGRIK